jgi:hypothetical protein
VKYLKIQKESAKFNESDAVEIRAQNFTGESYNLRRLANLMDVIFGFDREDPMCSFPEDAAIQENMMFPKDLSTKPAKYYYE